MYNLKLFYKLNTWHNRLPKMGNWRNCIYSVNACCQ